MSTPKAPRRPHEADPNKQLQRAQQLAREFLTRRLLSDAGDDAGDDITTYVTQLYDASGHNAYLSWLLRTDPHKADEATTAVELEACLAGYAFGLAVGALLDRRALQSGGGR